MLSAHRLTESIAGGQQLTGAVHVLRAVANRRHGGYILAFHSAPVDTMTALVEGLHPDTVVSLDEIVSRHRSLTGAAIIGLLEPPGRVASGQILLERQRIDNLGNEEMRHIRGRRIGAIFQDPLTSLNPLYTVGRQLTETILAHLPVTPAEARQRAIALLQDTGIPAAAERIDHYPHQFSGGMRPRVVIALALAAEPKLIVAVEPTTALDVSIQAQIITLLKNICKSRGAAVMLITHDMGVIAETCDRVAVLYPVRVAEIGPVHDVINKPSHPYTSGLMASIPDMTVDRERLNQIALSLPGE